MTASPPRDLGPEALRRLAHARLDQALAPGALLSHPPRVSDFALNGPPPGAAVSAQARPAAVLAPIVARRSGLTVLLTLRSPDLRSHSGQVAFPGGKVDEGETPAQTALREAEEEIGLEARYVEPLGWLDPYLTGTGYRIAPLVALVDPDFRLTINPNEVAEVFEAPFAFLMDVSNHRVEETEWQGGTRKFYAMPYQGRYIWGATAGILRNLHERLFS